jgi:hypothetical protein
MRNLAFSLGLSLLASTAAAQCFDSAYGTPLLDSTTSGPDIILPIQPIGFAFPIGAVTYTDIHICDKGYVFLSNGGTPVPGFADFTASATELVSDSPRICALWSDVQTSFFNNNGQVYIRSTPSVCVITWENAQCYQATSGVFNLQMQLFPNGDVKFLYGPGATNQSVATNPTWQVGIVGISPGLGATQPAASDLSAGGATNDDTLYEEFTIGGSFDMPNNGLLLVRTSPSGYAFLPLGAPANCATVSTFGTGCTQSADSFYEEWLAGFDLNNTTVTWLRTGASYVVLTTVPGAFVTPSASATNIAPSALDGEQLVTLSAPMPVPGGTTTTLNVTTKGQIEVAPAINGIIDFTPTPAELLASARTTWALWHDYDQTDTGSGLILFEEVGGVAYFTWNGVHGFSTSTPNTFQFQFTIATGDVRLVINQMGSFAAPDAGVLGYSVGGASIDPGASDLSALTGAITVNDVGDGVALGADSAPFLGNAAFNLVSTNVPTVAPVALQFFGTTALNPGLDLTFLGMPTCFAYTSGDLGAGTFLVAGGTGAFTLSIPNSTPLIGVSLSTQSVVFTTATAFGLATSNGLVFTLGL